MNSTMVHLPNRSAMENGIAVASTGYLPSPSGLASIEPQAGVGYDYRAAVDTLGAQQHSLGMNIFALGLLPGIVSNSQVPFTTDPPHPATIDFTYSSFDRTMHDPCPPEANHGSNSNYNYFTGAHSPSPPIAAGSISVLPEQRPTINGTQSSAPFTACPRISNIRGHPRSERGFFVSKDTIEDTPSPPIEGPTSTTQPFPDTFPSASLPGVYSATESGSSTFLPYPRGRFSTSTPIPQEPAYLKPGRASSASPVHHPVPPTCHSRFLSSAGPSAEKPQAVARPVPQKECTEQEKAGRTLRSVRTRSEDVFAEYEPGADRTGGRWVCQCGSTFVRDSDWERHAMHSLSHSEGGGYDCSICDISFTRSDAMFRHRRKKHGDTMPGGKVAER